ncbi:MAG: hypothetical protein C4293_21655, partial [Nitrospiraceae bacterium]
SPMINVQTFDQSLVQGVDLLSKRLLLRETNKLNEIGRKSACMRITRISNGASWSAIARQMRSNR